MKAFKKFTKIFHAKVRGHIDYLDGNRLYGWVLNEKDPNHRVEVEVLLDDMILGSGIADHYRADLVEVFGGDGKHGFEIVISEIPTIYERTRINLREKQSRKEISSNRFFIYPVIDEVWFDYLYKNYMLELDIDRVIEGINRLIERRSYKKILTLLKKHYSESEEACGMRNLLMLALSQSAGNHREVLKYYRMLQRCPGGQLEAVARLMICDDALRSLKKKPGEWIAPQQVRALELLIVALEEMEDDPIEISFSFDEEHFEVVISYMIRTGMFVGRGGLRVLQKLIKGSSLDLEKIHALLQTGRRIHQAIHRGDPSFWQKALKIAEEYQSLQEILPHEALYKVILDYFDILNVSDDRLEMKVGEVAERLLPILSKKIDDKTLLDLRKMEWFYLNDAMSQSIKILEKFIKNNPYFPDWKSRYFPEVLWQYYQAHDRKVDARGLIDMLYTRFHGDRASIEEEIILLSDLLRWKETAGLGTALELTKSLVEKLYEAPDAQKVAEARKSIRSLLNGTHERYVENALRISEALGSDESSSFLWRQVEAFSYEEQNLFALSMNSERNAYYPFCSRYAALIDTDICESVEKWEKEEKSRKFSRILLVVKVGSEDFEKIRLYYHALLKRLAQRAPVVLCLDKDGYRKISWQRETGIEEEMEEKPYELESWDALYLLGIRHLPHHCFDDARYANVPLSIWEGQEFFDWSYRLSSEEFGRFGLMNGETLTLEKMEAIRKRLYSLKEKSLFLKIVPGRLSFRNLEQDELQRLCDFSQGLIEVDEPTKAMEYLEQLYVDPRIGNLQAINVKNTVLIRLKEATASMDAKDLACFLVQRNEWMRLEGFFDYYRRMGVSRFYVVDNASDDSQTLDFLLDQEDVELYSTPQAYSQSLYGVKWAEVLIQAKRVGKWNLLVDADEILMLDEDFADIPELCRSLEREGYDALYTPFLDMYSDRPIGKTPYAPGERILEHCHYYDKHFYTTFTVYGGIDGLVPTYQGGIRSRMFGLDKVVLNKLPLFRYTPKMKIREGIHWIDRARYKMGVGVLLHFKYIETFHDYVEREIARGQHWNGASEYRKYHEMLRNDPEFSLYDPTLSTPFRGVKDFFDNFSIPYHFAKEEF